MASFIELIAKIKQKNNGTFKLVDAQDVECEDGKGLDEVLNEKLDKNQGIENVGKTMVVGADGNLVVGDSSPKNVYTKEEVDYLLNDKMDKPYVPIEITDNATITDALEGNFKIDKIKGNTYQNVETDIVPTPNRPVPINSRKTLVTKTNPNMFNFEKENDTSSIPDTGTYRSIGQYQLKANTKYIFEWSEATVPAKATLSFQIQDEKGTVLVSPFTYFNLQVNEKKEAGKQVEFTTNESGIIKFAYNCVVATSSTTETYQQYWYTKILKDISLKEDVEYEPEYVELRSLKETSNLFDKNIMAFTFGTLNSNGIVETNVSYAVSGFVPVEPSTQYTIKVIDGFRGSTKVYYDINKQLILNEGITTFTTPSNCYFVRWQTATTDTRVLTEEDIQKINDEMMMVKGDSLPSTYVPPTVRDYKIIDHTNKTAKIIRNVGLYKDDKTGNGWTAYNNQTFQNSYFKNIKDMKRSNRILSYSNSFEVVNENTGVGNANSMWIGVTNSNVFVIRTDFKTIEEWKTWLTNNDLEFVYPLAMPIEQSIEYVETDVSEVGYSWQDTTSPSPTIKSEVKGVEEIDILIMGENLFDFSKVKKSDDLTIDYENKTITIMANTNNAGYVNNLKDLMGGYKIGEKYVMSAKTSNPEALRIIYFLDIQDSIKFDEPFTLTEEMLNSPFAWYNNIESKNQNVISNIQIELGDTATAYEPYAEQCVNYTPTNPMYSTQDGSICDYVDVEKGVEVYNMSGAVVFDGSEDENWLTNDNGFFIKIVNIITVLNSANFWCDSYTVKVSLDKGNVYINAGFMYFQIDKNQITSIEEWKQYISQKPITVVYPLATPTETPIPLEDLAKLKSLKTNAGVNNIFVGGEVKPTINARYPRDLALVQQQLEQKILLISDSLIDTQAKVLLQGGN